MVKKINSFLRIIRYSKINAKQGNLKMRDFTETDLQKIKQFCQEKDINEDVFLTSKDVKYFDNLKDLKEMYIDLYYDGISSPDYLDNMSFKRICNLFTANYHYNFVLMLDNNRALICVYADQVFFSKELKND